MATSSSSTLLDRVMLGIEVGAAGSLVEDGVGVVVSSNGTARARSVVGGNVGVPVEGDKLGIFVSVPALGLEVGASVVVAIGGAVLGPLVIGDTEGAKVGSLVGLLVILRDGRSVGAMVTGATVGGDVGGQD